MKAFLQKLFGGKQQATIQTGSTSNESAGVSLRRELTSTMFLETRISLSSEERISSVEVVFATAIDFASWCDKNGFIIEKRFVDSGNVVCGGSRDENHDVRKTFLTTPSRLIDGVQYAGDDVAEVQSSSTQAIVLGSACWNQKQLIEFCRQVCGSSSRHGVYLRGEHYGSFTEFFNRLPPSAKSDRPH